MSAKDGALLVKLKDGVQGKQLWSLVIEDGFP